MMVSVASWKGSPGVTTVSALLAAHWGGYGDRRIIMEVDPSGGTLAARWSSAHGLTWDPGLLDLSSIRRDLDHDVLDQVSQAVGDGISVISAPPGTRQISRGIERMGDRIRRLGELEDVVVFADLGRLTASSPVLGVARSSVLTLMVCRTSLEQIQGLVPIAAELKSVGCRLGLVAVDSGPYQPEEAADVAGIELIGVIPHAPKSAAMFDSDGLMAGRAFWRSAMCRGARQAADDVRDRVMELVGGADVNDWVPPRTDPDKGYADLDGGPQFSAGNSTTSTEVGP